MLLLPCMSQSIVCTCSCQDQNVTCQQYFDTFKNHMDVIEYCGGAFDEDPRLIDDELSRIGMLHRQNVSDDF